MKITVMGTGGVGGYFGARLADAGHDVAFIARGKHLEYMKQNGLKVYSELGDTTINPIKVSENPEEFGVADIILFCVKAFDTQTAANLIKPITGNNTGVIPFLNGLGHVDILKATLGENAVIGGVANISALIEEPGVIRHFSTMQILRVGELNGTSSERVGKFRDACNDAAIEAPVPENIERELWQKIVMICTLAGANCLTRLPLGYCRSNPKTRDLMVNLTAETVAVARALNISLPDNQVDLTMKLLEALPATMKASILAALERGEKLEASALNGAIERLGKENKIDTPSHRAVYAALAPHEHGIPNAL
jgi:2-dehydropantoate 2-reductase